MTGLSLTHVYRRLLRIRLEETGFERRGFRYKTASARDRLEKIGGLFLRGYHAALREDDPAALVIELNKVEREFRGFAYEGAAMALTLLDHLTLRKRRLQTFLAGHGSAHAYMVLVGVGWALARLPWQRPRLERALAGFDPLLRWLVVDGYGFHAGFFEWRRYANSQAAPPRLSAYGRRVFDQGLGRSLWFIDGADVELISRTIAAFDAPRRADLWSGVGLACAYAGGINEEDVERLRAAAGPYTSHVAQGCAFAAKARQRARNPAAHTEVACRVLCGVSAEAAAGATDEALASLPNNAAEPAYECWRRLIREKFESDMAAV